MITDPVFYLVAIPGVLIAGVAKGGFGGLMVMAVPVMALLRDPREVAAILLPILCVMDLFSVWKFRGYWDVANLRLLLPASLVGIAIGAASFHWLDANALRLIIGVIALGFIANWWFKRKRATAPHVPSNMQGYFWGMLAGFTSFSAHSGTAPASMYLLPQQLDKMRLAGTFAVFFAFVNYVKLVPYSFLDQLPVTNLTTSLVLLPVGYVGVKLGFWMHGRVSEKRYYQISYSLLFILSLKLLYDALLHYWPN
jgi:uncharacterized membrane protein YfcA